MENLKQYVERLNFWNEMSKRPLLTFPLSRADAEKIVYNLEGDLSPENLHCDGEISRAEASAKYNFYMNVYIELEEHVGYVPALEY